MPQKRKDLEAVKEKEEKVINKLKSKILNFLSEHPEDVFTVIEIKNNLKIEASIHTYTEACLRLGDEKKIEAIWDSWNSDPIKQGIYYGIKEEN